MTPLIEFHLLLAGVPADAPAGCVVRDVLNIEIHDKIPRREVPASVSTNVHVDFRRETLRVVLTDVLGPVRVERGVRPACGEPDAAARLPGLVELVPAGKAHEHSLVVQSPGRSIPSSAVNRASLNVTLRRPYNGISDSFFCTRNSTPTARPVPSLTRRSIPNELKLSSDPAEARAGVDHDQVRAIDARRILAVLLHEALDADLRVGPEIVLDPEDILVRADVRRAPCSRVRGQPDRRRTLLEHPGARRQRGLARELVRERGARERKRTGRRCG